MQHRALAMTIVASGSSMGSIIQPIMLNNLLNTHGFKTAAVANAALITGLLLWACLLMRTRLPPPSSTLPFKTAIVKFSNDGAYMVGCFGWVTSMLARCSNVNVSSRLLLFSVGYFYPLFYIQLDAELHGLSSNINFYIVRASCFKPPSVFNDRPIVGHFERFQFPWKAQRWFHCDPSWCSESDHDGNVWMLSCDTRYDWGAFWGWFYCNRHSLWVLRGDMYVFVFLLFTGIILISQIKSHRSGQSLASWIRYRPTGTGVSRSTKHSPSPACWLVINPAPGWVSALLLLVSEV